jgi:hypothetical protein
MIVLPGFDCANPQCQGWTGTAKEDHKVCRFCGTPRPVEPVPLYRIRQTRWHVKYTEADEPTPDKRVLDLWDSNQKPHGARARNRRIVHGG